MRYRNEGMAMKQAAALLAQEDDDDDEDENENDKDHAMANGAQQQQRDGMSAVPPPVPSLPNGMQTDAL